MGRGMGIVARWVARPRSTFVISDASSPSQRRKHGLPRAGDGLRARRQQSAVAVYVLVTGHRNCALLMAASHWAFMDAHFYLEAGPTDANKQFKKMTNEISEIPDTIFTSFQSPRRWASRLSFFFFFFYSFSVLLNGSGIALRKWKAPNTSPSAYPPSRWRLCTGIREVRR